jgi:hypothetical protein
MNKHEGSATYIGDKYRHTESGFSGVVVKETQPSHWPPERVIFTLESANGEQKAFRLRELEEDE